MVWRLLFALLLLWPLAVRAQAPSIMPPIQVGEQYTGGCNPSRPLPLDATSISWGGAYGVCSLTTKWLNGRPLFDIVVGGNTYTIKSVNGFPDVRKLAGLLGVSTNFGTAGAAVSTWYDQSGNANNCTQSTSANRFAVWLINGRVSMAFDGFLVDYGSGSNADKYCTISNGLATNNQNTTVYAALQPVSSGAAFGYGVNDLSDVFALGNDGTSGFGLGGAGGTSKTLWQSTSLQGAYPASASTLWLETQPSVIGVISGSSSLTITQNEEISSGLTAVLSGTASGGTIGAFPFFSFNGGYYGRMYSLMVAGAANATSGQQTSMRSALYALHGISKATAKYAILIDGASLDVGTGALIAGINGYGWAEQMLSQIPYPIRMGNTAVYGATIANLNSTIATSQCNFFQSGPKNILFFPQAAAGNSISGGETGAQAYADLQTGLTAYKACANPPSTIYVSLFGTVATGEYANYNALVIANAASLGIIPFSNASDCAMNAIIDGFVTSNAQYFNQTPSWLVNHPRIIGYQNFAMCGLAVLQSLIGP